MLANVAMGVVAYTVGALFLARMASDKWHPDGSKNATAQRMAAK
jgi:hypothetical protein